MSVRALVAEDRPAGDLVLLHDMSFVTRRSEETRRYVFALFVGLGVIVSLLTVVIAQLSWRGWEQGMRALLRGEGLLRASNRSGRAGIPAAGARPARVDSRHRIGAPAARRRSVRLVAGCASRRAAPRVARAGSDRGVEPRALHSHAQG